MNVSNKNIKSLPKLGRGLEAVFGKSFIGGGRSVVEIPIKDIIVNRYQPRRHFDEDGMKKLINSIQQNGLAQPILVRPADSGGYELIAGERRLRACVESNMVSIPAIIKPMSNLESLQIALVENLDREDLNSIEEAEGYSRLIREFSYSHKMLAEFFGKSRSAISNSLRLLNLPEFIKVAVMDSRLSEGHARALLGLSTADLQEEFFKLTLEKSLSVRQLEKLVALKNKLLQDSSNQLSMNQELGFYHEEKFNSIIKRFESFGFKVNYSGTDQKGKVSLSYSSKEDYDRLVLLLSS